MEDKIKVNPEEVDPTEVVIDADQVFTSSDQGEGTDSNEPQHEDTINRDSNFLSDKSAPDLVTFASMILSGYMKGKAVTSNSKFLDIGSTLVSAIGFTTAKKMDSSFTFERFEKNEKAYESLLASMLSKTQEESSDNHEESNDKSKA